ncbi:MAG: DNA methyltransferase [Candidatus Cloacimonetes bacterium]|nr:DNA methyltransferase [Candidatus Cloacimonadota bacterium]
MSYSIQRKSSLEQNKLYSEDTKINDWYRFVLSFPPHLVRDYIHKFNLSTNQTVLDPFCGTGTTLVECKKLGIPSFGIEANPVVKMAAQTKVNWDIDYNKLLKHSILVAQKANNLIRHSKDDFKVLDEEKSKLIINNSISPIPLHKSLILLEVLESLREEQFYDIERTAFAKQLVFSYSNLKFGPEVGVGRKKKIDVEVVDLWLNQIKKMVSDLKEYQLFKKVKSKIFLGDSRTFENFMSQKSIDAVITSPPYPNEKDYTRTTRLESVILGFMKTKADLRAAKEKLIRSNTRNIYKGDNDKDWIKSFKQITDLADNIESRRLELGKTSGFERLYHKVVRNYFGGMARHLSELQSILNPGAQLAYVVGDQASYFRIPIRTGKIISEIAVDLGYELVGIDLFRTRLSTVTKEHLREEVVLLKWRG